MDARVEGSSLEATACPRCGTPSVPAQRFCGSCGEPLGHRCSSCGSDNPATYRFCGVCGAGLEAAAPEAPLGEERRWATVLFADLSGFTSLSERMDPEDVRSLVDRCMARMGEIVARYGGSVLRVVGDEILALFGAPVAHEDDPERAVRAALELQRCAEEHAEEFGGLPLRVGVNTGEMMFAPVGPKGAREFTVMGDVVNTASRLQSAAPVGGILVGEATYGATRQAVRYEPVAPFRAKGKEAPVGAWRALEAPALASVRPVSAVSMVGRDTELEMLGRIWERVVAERRPHLVTILGAPGIGKTRLARELVARAETRGGRCLHGRCLPYGERTGYGAFAEQVKELAGIFETDPAPEARQKLTAACRVLSEEDAEQVASHLAVLLGLGGEDGTPEKGPLLYSARRFVEAVGRAVPTVFVFEDVHWSDPSLLELIEAVAVRTRETAVLLLTLARPELLESRPTWGGGLSSYTALPLEPLSEVNGRDLARRLAPHLGGEVATQLAEVAGGNPLFIEELAASVSHATAEFLANLPSNVKAIIAARLDTLPFPERQVLLDASVVGKIFWRGALERLGQHAGLPELLDSLEERDLIRRQPASRFRGDAEFSFKHMLIREVAYATLPRAARRERHATVAWFLEEAAGDRVAESASLLAHHWREAGETDRALRHLLLAAEHASRAWAKAEAITLYGQALELIPEEDRARRASTRLRRALTQVENGDYTGAAAELDAVLPDLHGQERLEALLARAHACFWLAPQVEHVAFASLSQEASELADTLGDEHLRARALAVASQGATFEPDLGRAIELGEEALAAWWPGSHMSELGVHAMLLGAYHYWVGNYERSFDCSQRAYDLGLETQSVEAMLAGGADLGMALAGLGRHEEALEVLDRVIAQGREVELQPQFTARAINIRAGTLREVFELERARELNEEGIDLARRADFIYADIQGRVDLLVADLAEGDVGSAERAWPRLWEDSEGTMGLHRWLTATRLATAKAEIVLALGKAEEAAEAAHDAVVLAERCERLKYQVASRLALGSALLQMGRVPEAVTELRRASEGAEQLGHPPTRWRVALALRGAFAATGDDEAAEAASLSAVHTIRAFAHGLSQERRARFLAVPQVQDALAATG